MRISIRKVVEILRQVVPIIRLLGEQAQQREMKVASPRETRGFTRTPSRWEVPGRVAGRPTDLKPNWYRLRAKIGEWFWHSLDTKEGVPRFLDFSSLKSR